MRPILQSSGFMEYQECQIFTDIKSLVKPNNIQISFSKLVTDGGFIDFLKFQKDVTVLIPRDKRVFKAKISHDVQMNIFSIYPKEPIELDPGDHLLILFPRNRKKFITQCKINKAVGREYVLSTLDPRCYDRIDTNFKATTFILAGDILNHIIEKDLQLWQQLLMVGHKPPLKGGLATDFIKATGGSPMDFLGKLMEKQDKGVEGTIQDISMGGMAVVFSIDQLNRLRNQKLLYIYSELNECGNELTLGKFLLIRRLSVKEAEMKVVCHGLFLDIIHADSFQYIYDMVVSSNADRSNSVLANFEKEKKAG